MLYRPQDIAAKLGIAPSTLRLWSARFAGELSDAARKSPAGALGPAAQRRYTPEDLHVLFQIKGLLGQGNSYPEAKRLLQALPPPSCQQSTSAAPEHIGVSAQASSAQALAPLQEALGARDRTIAALRESLQFMDAYLQAARQEREEAREHAEELEKELEEVRCVAEARFEKLCRPWWKQLLGVP
ncbi:MAG: MerR family transcriptional regulator [Chloroflexota bacterium]